MGIMGKAVLFAVFLAALFSAAPALGQSAGAVVPEVAQAERAFRAGLDAFEAGEYEGAYRRFRQVYEGALNRKTTAARLMAGKALYRLGRFAEVADLLSEFVRRYPLSSYVDEARQTLARAQAKAARTAGPVTLGIVLPRSADPALTQALFNGIRLAVDEHNAAPGAVPVRMAFRDSGGEAARAGSAVSALVEEADPELIIGPLYSREAFAAAEAAEEAGVVLIAPLATDEGIAEGKTFVFQANPTITLRGRQMARYAIRSLGLNNVGVIAQVSRESVSERMGEGFQDEAFRLGANVGFYSTLPSESAWARLPEEIGALQLSQVEAVYMPLAGGDVERNAGAALDGLIEMEADVAVLGNSEWHGLGIPAKATRFGTTYTTDFLVDESSGAVRSFLARYEELTGEPLPERDRRLPITGYDVARFALTQLRGARGEELASAMREAAPYEGLGVRIDFGEGNVNEAAYLLQYREGGVERLAWP